MLPVPAVETLVQLSIYKAFVVLYILLVILNPDLKSEIKDWYAIQTRVSWNSIDADFFKINNNN